MVRDYFARVEFQNRGSPHIHMFLWIDGVPNEITNESVPNLVSYINSTIRSCLPDSEDEELNYLVKKLQTHSHTTYCTKSYKAS